MLLHQVLPDPMGEFSLNVCRNPDCLNFGVLPDPKAAHGGSKRARGLKKTSNSDAAPVGKYTLQSRSEESRTSRGIRSDVRWADDRLLECDACGTTISILSNQAFDEEFRRLYFMPEDLNPGPACPRCETRYVDRPHEFTFDGRHGSGVKIVHRCGGSNSTKRSRFTYTPEYARQRKSSDNHAILTALVNGAGLNDILRSIRTARGGSLGVQRLYDRIFWLERVLLSYERAQLREWRRDQSLVEAEPHYVVAQDTLDLSVNWETAEDARNTIIKAHVSADVKSGFIYRIDAAFDGSIDPVQFFEDNISPKSGVRISKVYRQKSGRVFRHPKLSFQRPSARFQEHLFFASLLHQLALFKERDAVLVLDSEIRDALVSESERKIRRVKRIYREYYDIKQSERDHRSTFRGAVVSHEYSLAAHFAALREDLGPGRFTVYTDANPTLVRFMPIIFRREVERDDFCWVVNHLPTKNVSKPKRAQMVSEYRARFRGWFEEQGLVGSFREHRAEFIAAKLVTSPAINNAFTGPGFSGARWYRSPISTYYEPAKQVGIVLGPKWFRSFAGDIANEERAGADLSERSAHSEMNMRRFRDFVSASVDQATLQPVDTFLNSLRERLSPTKRSSSGGGSMTRTYIQGNIYNPRVLVALLNIFRVYYNFFELRPYETDTIDAAELSGQGRRLRRVRVPWTNEAVEISSKGRAPVRRLTPAMRHGIHRIRPGETPKAPDIVSVLSRPWEVHGTRLFEKLTGARKDMRRHVSK